MCQLLAGPALNLEQDDAARLPDHADDGVWARALSARKTFRVVVNLLADLESVD